MDRSRVGRGVAVLAVAALVVAVVSPAFSAAPLTRAKVKKIAKKVARQQIRSLGRSLFIEEEGELVRYGPIALGVGGTAPVAIFGPFTFTASCTRTDDADPTNDPDPLEGEVLIDTAEDNAAFESNDDAEDDFDAADPPEEWGQETGNDPDVLNEQDLNDEDDEDAHALSAGGTALSGGTTVRIGSAGDADSGCTFAGSFLVLAPA